VVAALPAAHVRIVGDGESNAPLGRAIDGRGLGSHVELTGALPHDHLPDVYCAADLYVQASLHEAQGMAVLEAAACGVPSVGTAVGALCDLAPEAARTTEADAHALAQAIIELARDEARRRELGRAARA